MLTFYVNTSRYTYISITFGSFLEYIKSMNLKNKQQHIKLTTNFKHIPFSCMKKNGTMYQHLVGLYSF